MDEKKRNKKESQLITKESLYSVGGVFSFLAVLVLCTKSLVFGDVGVAVYACLTGLFGYIAYPIGFGLLYLCVSALFDKRYVKDRKFAWLIALCCICIALLIHTITTYNQLLAEKYLQFCFGSGSTNVVVTVAGVIGGLIVYGLASLITPIGAIVVFALLVLALGYLTVIYFKRKTFNQNNTLSKDKAKEEKTSSVRPVEIPISIVDETQQNVTPPSKEFNGLKTKSSVAEVTQRPAFTIQEDANAESTQKSGGFSPFATPNQTKFSPSVVDAQTSRAVLFDSTSPVENFKRNLIFDPNASVNKRNAYPSQNDTAFTNASYTDGYQEEVNDNPRPMRVLIDNTKPSYTTSVTPTAPIIQAQPIEPATVSTMPREERVNTAFEEEKINETPTQDTYRRHENMDLFSLRNPNVFGVEEENRELARKLQESEPQNEVVMPRDRDDTEESFKPFTRETVSFTDNQTFAQQVEKEDRTSVGRGIDIFDEKEDLYSLRAERTEERSTSFNDETGRNNRFEEVERNTRFDETGRNNRFEEVERNTRFEETGRNNRFDEVEEEPSPAPQPPKPRIILPYVRVPLDDFDCRDVEPAANQLEVEETKENILATLEQYRVEGATVASVVFGPTVTRYNIVLPRSVPPKKVTSLEEEISMSLRSAGVNVYANYDDGVVSIECPNRQRQFVRLGSMLTGDTFVNAKPGSLMFVMGKGVVNNKVYGDITKMTHLLVAGASNSGKSVFLGALILSLIYKYSPEELRLILIDPKKTEFVLYNGLPHLLVNEIISDVQKTVQSLNWAIDEMERRYTLFKEMSLSGKYVVNLDQYNENLPQEERLPKIVIIIDELADLMLNAKKDIEDKIQSLTQKARAAGIHIIVATQRPSADIITGAIKSNLSTRIAFAVPTDVDSRVILDQSGAQKLLGKGDFLYTMPGVNTPVRVQSAFSDPEESQRVVNFIKNNNQPYFDESIASYINNTRDNDVTVTANATGDEVEPVFILALKHVILLGSASIALIRRKCAVGYSKAGQIIEWMENMGYISGFDGAKARKVFITPEEFESKYGNI